MIVKLYIQEKYGEINILFKVSPFMIIIQCHPGPNFLKIKLCKLERCHRSGFPQKIWL